MTIQKTLNGKTVLLALEGRLDTTTAPQLEATLDECIGDCTELVFDFSGLEYISSAGLRVLLKAQKLMNTKGSMKITHVDDVIREVFDITGFLDILTIE